ALREARARQGRGGRARRGAAGSALPGGVLTAPVLFRVTTRRGLVYCHAVEIERTTNLAGDALREPSDANARHAALFARVAAPVRARRGAHSSLLPQDRLGRRRGRGAGPEASLRARALAPRGDLRPVAVVQRVDLAQGAHRLRQLVPRARQAARVAPAERADR